MPSSILETDDTYSSAAAAGCSRRHSAGGNQNASSKQYADCRAANRAVEHQHWQPRSRLAAACDDVALRANVAPVL